MVTTLKLYKDLNSITLEELINSLRSHEIKLEDDEPQKINKYVALKSKIESLTLEKNKAFQAENFEESDDEYSDDDDDDDEFSLLSRRVKQL